MQARELKISGAFEFTPSVFPDDRGLFVAPFQEEPFRRAVGHGLRVAQTNHSESRRGVVRGVHYADVPPGQAKYVHCPRGKLLDVVVDLRVGSPTFGQWDTVVLEPAKFNSVYVPEGLGHALMALEDGTITSYLCSEGFNPKAERGINPLSLDLPWPADITPILSLKDQEAPTLEQAQADGLLPSYEECTAWYAKLQ
ncbi:dTDP-4-dehydrorhamnose 3,5-epimerase family protein [Saccharothrix coeruleofusca]|uniref:dTDP-4-dehydrorhamnose 3,5-epimerase n=1 Tax=Saccharothrix coeruleofusca TaxID=33919 RepID=A0A918AQI0_9PSEU|nr:dTDP-4-dehydrorhamnose 3,5-epimerase family protein [Saccharothrix coeruleofusca]MBP2339031.1 dTDP-4-dehydrorhamnose 3,5-epimerase [Saccharothrix coeruleofusca]GGP69629.1 dTDP-4-dehydrorhamnose 3,5-epimerase [Saccharothrix coeruleofusca]